MIARNDDFYINMFLASLSFRGAFLEDAMFVSCGHSFGGMMLRKVIELVSDNKKFLSYTSEWIYFLRYIGRFLLKNVENILADP